MWSENHDELTDKEEYQHLSDILPLEGDERKVKEEKGVKVSTRNKFLTKFLILLVQIKAGKNSYKLKNDVILILYLLFYQHNKITKKAYNNLINLLL